jgi:NTP pyrophosphatase (non-canonical NTP hydrolase)
MNKDEFEPLCILQEECAEVIHVISKGYRFGFDTPFNIRTSRQNLNEEIGDVLCMIDILIDKGFIDPAKIELAKQDKKHQLKRWSNIKFNSEE